MRVGRAADVGTGAPLIVDVNGRSIGIFNLGDGRFVGMHNRCPHMGAAICDGRITGTSQPVDDYTYRYGQAGRILRCPWHGWEFEIESGRALADRRMRVRTYEVSVEDGDLILHLRRQERASPASRSDSSRSRARAVSS